jgi:hypothetical protein
MRLERELVGERNAPDVTGRKKEVRPVTPGRLLPERYLLSARRGSAQGIEIGARGVCSPPTEPYLSAS